MSEYIYSWEFDDRKNRWSLWYIIAVSFVLWLSIWWFLTKQYWLSFIILLIWGLVYFVENNSEDIVEVKISNLWVKIASVFYNFSSINSFWIVYKWEQAVLLRFNLNKKWIKSIDVKLDNTILEQVKGILPNYLTETPKIELTFSEKLIQLLKL